MFHLKLSFLDEDSFEILENSDNEAQESEKDGEQKE